MIKHINKKNGIQFFDLHVCSNKMSDLSLSVRDTLIIMLLLSTHTLIIIVFEGKKTRLHSFSKK